MTDNSPKTGRAARPTDPESVERRAKLESWQKELSDQSVSEIIRYRDLRGISNDELRRRLAALGWDLTRDSLASILSAKRKAMPVTDVLLFAQALNVPPAALIFPTSTNEPTRLWPADESASYAYRDVQWLSGALPDHGGAHVAAPESAVVDDYYDIGDIVGRFEEIDDIERNAFYSNYQLARGDLEGNQRRQIEAGLRGQFKDLADLRTFLTKVHKGIRMPPLHAAISFLDDRDYTLPPLPIEAYLVHPIHGRALREREEVQDGSTPNPTK